MIICETVQSMIKDPYMKIKTKEMYGKILYVALPNFLWFQLPKNGNLEVRLINFPLILVLALGQRTWTEH